MLRAGLVAFFVGPAAAGLTDDCMKGLQQLDGGSDAELSLRCRAAFGLEACKQARQSLGAQPWTQARMEGSCKQFAAAYQGMDTRSLEEAVSTKTSTDATTPAKSPAPPPSAPIVPIPQKQHQEGSQGPVANLLKKLTEKKEAEGKAKVATSDAKEGPLAGLISEIKEGKAAQPADAGEVEQDQKGALVPMFKEADKKEEGPLAGLISKIKEGKAAQPADAGEVEQDQKGALVSMFKEADKKEDEVESPIASLIKKMKAEKEAHEVEQDQQGPLAAMFKHGEKAPIMSLYNMLPIAQPEAPSRMPEVLAAFAGAAGLAAVTLFVASRRGAPRSHEQLREQLSEPVDAEKIVE